jgi:hypothetical protein
VKKDQEPVRVGFILIDAYREEAKLHRESGQESRAIRLEALADKLESLSNGQRS